MNSRIVYDSPRERAFSDAARGYAFTDTGRISLASLKNQAEGLKASGNPFNEAGENPTASQQIGDTRAKLSAMQSQVYEPNAASRSAVAGAGLEALDAFAPLAEGGMIDPEQLGSLLTKEVGGAFQTQQQQRAITREIQAIAQQVRAGRLTMDAGTKALADVHVEYGNAIYSNPAFVQFAGLEKQLEKQRGDKKAQYATQIGASVDQTMWDEKANRPVLDTQALQDAALIQQSKDIPWKRDLEVKKLVAGKQQPAPKRADFRTGIPGHEAADNAAYQEAVIEYNKAQQARTSFLVSGVPGADEQVQQLYGESLKVPAAKSPSVAGEDVVDSTPQDLELVDKQIRAGQPGFVPGWYIGLDGRKGYVNGE